MSVQVRQRRDRTTGLSRHLANVGLHLSHSAILVSVTPPAATMKLFRTRFGVRSMMAARRRLYRSIVEPTRASVVVVLNAGVAVGLGTIVGAEGWVVTKASELPGV